MSDLFRIVQFFATPNNSSRSSRPKINVCVSSQPKTILKDMHFCVSKLALLSGNSGTFVRQNGHFVNHAPHHAHATSTVTHSLTLCLLAREPCVCTCPVPHRTRGHEISSPPAHMCAISTVSWPAEGRAPGQGQRRWLSRHSCPRRAIQRRCGHLCLSQLSPPSACVGLPRGLTGSLKPAPSVTHS